MLDYNEIKEKKVIIYENDPYEVLESHVARTQQRKPQNQVKMRNLITGRSVTTTFHASDRADEADMSNKEIKFLYANKGEYWFCEQNNPSNRFTILESIIGEKAKYLKANDLVDALIFTNDDEEEKIIGIKMPIKMDFKVVEAPPSMKGNTAQGGNKLVKIETGAMIQTPLFVNEGDTIRINTDTGEYTERV